MSASQSSTKTVAIFGATGGTGLAALKNSLQAGHHVNVLARTPAKLSTLQSQYPTTLHINQGDIRSIPDIKKTLISTTTGNAVDVIISAIGMFLKGLLMTSDDPTICYDGTLAILTALKELETEGKVKVEPRIVLLSTTGISSKRDIPLGMIPLYHAVLCVPHKDKKEMEKLMIEGEGRHRDWVMIRPSFLVDGEPKGLESVRVSSEKPGEEKKEATAVGYTIRREDVGLWIVEECVKSTSADRWSGRIVSMTN
ncbi:hypothetical protein BGZ60DRAFT_428523 [Tricladium varicosporioides]|nr:hypothetical protein BGZ60DRAFT_428523 [Hymenoscyphus varicosporioides]